MGQMENVQTQQDCNNGVKHRPNKKKSKTKRKMRKTHPQSFCIPKSKKYQLNLMLTIIMALCSLHAHTVREHEFDNIRTHPQIFHHKFHAHTRSFYTEVANKILLVGGCLLNALCKMTFTAPKSHWCRSNDDGNGMANGGDFISTKNR